MRRVPPIPALLGVLLLAGGCSRSEAPPADFTEADVRAFFDGMQQVWERRDVGKICSLYAKDATVILTIHPLDPDQKPFHAHQVGDEICDAFRAGDMPEQELQRRQLAIEMSPDKRAAKVRAEFRTISPYYDPEDTPESRRDYQFLMVINSHADYEIAMEAGRLVVVKSIGVARVIEHLPRPDPSSPGT